VEGEAAVVEVLQVEVGRSREEEAEDGEDRQEGSEIAGGEVLVAVSEATEVVGEDLRLVAAAEDSRSIADVHVVYTLSRTRVVDKKSRVQTSSRLIFTGR